MWTGKAIEFFKDYHVLSHTAVNIKDVKIVQVSIAVLVPNYSGFVEVF